MGTAFLQYGLMIVAGMLLGAIFFGGLWITVRQMHKSRSPGLLFVTSVVIRSAVVLCGIWFFSAGDAASITACLPGFVAIRLLATHGAAVFGNTFGRREFH